MSDDMKTIKGSSAGEHGELRSMQEVAITNSDASRMLKTYNIAWWGNNYYDVNELGHISVCPNPDKPEVRVDLAKLVKGVKLRGSVCRRCFVFRRSCNIACAQSTKRSAVPVNRLATVAIISWCIPSRSISTSALSSH